MTVCLQWALSLNNWVIAVVTSRTTSLAAAVRQEVSSQGCSVVTGLNTSSISHDGDKELKMSLFSFSLVFHGCC